MTEKPWYRNALRWGQTNLVEIDPMRYDAVWWREHWRKTRIQGVIVNAGGIVAYYPSKFPLHRRAHTLGERDLLGEIVSAAREDGLQVIARMDSNCVGEDFFREHPDWICVDLSGDPYTRGDKFVTCINSPYYTEYLPGVIKEVIERVRPDGFADNSWYGLTRESVCYCKYCQRGFGAFSNGFSLPTSANWEDKNYRKWIQWSYARRVELWDLNNATTKEAGGPDCTWSGMISGDLAVNANRFSDLRQLLSRAKIVMLDHQRRSKRDSFEQNTECGLRLHELAGWDKLIPESMPQYLLGEPIFRLSSMPEAEVQMWSAAAFAGGIQPWWHHIGSSHEDRRQYKYAEKIFNWHRANAEILVNRTPQADVGVVWSQTNQDFYGQDKSQDKALNPYRGVINALNKSAITYLPIHVDEISKATGRFSLLILPSIVAMSVDQIDAVKAYIENGGSVIVTGDTSLMDENGIRRDDYGLAETFGVHRLEGHEGGELPALPADPSHENFERHSYLRLTPELRCQVYGPNDESAPMTTDQRHPILGGMDETDILPFGGFLPHIHVDQDVSVLATFVPDLPVFPPETVWMRIPRTEMPALAIRETKTGGKLVWIAADVDRCFGRDDHRDHGALIANAVKWAIDDSCFVKLENSHGLVIPTLYSQGNRQILHLNSRAHASRVPGSQDQLIPVGPVSVYVRTRQEADAPASVEFRVAGKTADVEQRGDFLVFQVDQILDHEVIVVDWR
ncbi:Tat pathway signal protein [Paraburkholderia sp. Cy-641]|uniref:alpha-amylase family protein n=1 Tax=Paraburkholderia sp. Cy-641 TaxID=2608337 RepID=UPI001423708D|nr:alpha-amylase family protein [Paraburkholderia sp. Cy-641]NIF80460.1 Tat pathway signal protein [Paraburkholderia sp. Cy-641]